MQPNATTAPEMSADELGYRRGSAVVGWGSVGLYLGILGTIAELFGWTFEVWFGLTFALFLVGLAASAPFVWRMDRVRTAGEFLNAVFWRLMLAGILLGGLAGLFKSVF